MKPVIASRTRNTERTFLIILIMVCVFFQACKKTVCPLEPLPPEEPKTKVGKLKEKIVEKLPSPMYLFDYTDSGVTTDINFASGYYIYKLSYVNGRLTRMTNTFNNNAMVYNYNNGKVVSIRDTRPDGKFLWNYSFDYTSGNQLKEVRWYRFNIAGTDSFLYRKVTLGYHADGNLAWYEDFRNVTGQLEWVQKMEYSNYDDGKNVDDFSILKEFGDNLLYLPGVRLQKNNARKELIFGPQNDYEVTNNWIYQDGRPVTKTGKLKGLRGNDTGDLGDYTTHFTYY